MTADKSTIVRSRVAGELLGGRLGLSLACLLALLTIGEAQPDDRDRDRRLASRTMPAGAADVNHGVRLARRGAFNEALAAFERAARRSPVLAEAHLNRGLLLAQQGRREEALRALRTALAIEPEMPEALEGMGLTLLLENRNAAAAAAYERAIGLGASSADAHYNMALARARLGQTEPALRACREALRRRPGMAKAQVLLEEVSR